MYLLQGDLEMPAGWLEHQPEPNGDCSSEEEHYVGLASFGSCPNCGQTEVLAADVAYEANVQPGER